MKIKLSLSVILGLILIFSCSSEQASPWASPDSWYQSDTEINDGFVDVLYLVSTNIIKSFNPDSTESYIASLTDDERYPLNHEMEYMQTMVFKDSLNFFAPFYHQMTMNAIMLPEDQHSLYREQVEAEVCDAFDWYMEHQNGGRRFILSGFSQGAMLLIALLDHMTDEQYSRLVAAYMIGADLDAEDLRHPHVKAAQSAYDTGVTVSFNSVASVDGIWDYVCSDPAVCINPVNWCTDATPAAIYDSRAGVELSVAVDPEYNVLVVTGYGDDLPTAKVAGPWPENCLHSRELILYAEPLGRNALDRAYRPEIN